jgi:hypothetical protein
MWDQLHSEMTARCWSVGYANRYFDDLVALIQTFEITHLVDVRTNAWSNYQPDFRGKEFADRLAGVGLKYVYVGDRLGNKPTQPEVLTDGVTDWAKMKVQPWFIEGLDKLEQACRRDGWRVCMLCGCSQPQECHRGKLLSELLLDRGIDSEHILQDGSVLLQSDLRSRYLGQSSLF